MRAPLCAFLLVVLTLAGCLQPSEPGAPIAPRLADLSFLPPVKMPGDRLGAEPNFATGPNGNVWIVAVGSVLANPQQNIARGAVNLWHSADFGTTWERLRDPGDQDKNGTFCSCDSDVDIGPDGTLYLTDFWVTSGGNGFTLESSPDGGQTWSPANFLTQTAPGGNDRQYVIAGREPGEVYLAYNGAGTPQVPGVLPVPAPVPSPPLGELPTSPASPGLTLWRSTDGGRTLQPASLVTGGGFIAKPRIGADSTIYYPWVDQDANATDAWNDTAFARVGVSHDRGQTFAPRDVATIPHGVGGLWPLQMDIGPDNVLHAVWMERIPAGGSRLWYSRSADEAATWTTPRNVGWTNGTALLPWISAAGPDRAVIAYYGSEVPVNPLEAPGDTRWDAWALQVTGNGSSLPARVSPWPVKVGTFCPRGAACPQDRELLDYPAVAWRDGWAHVAFGVSTLDPGAGPRPGEAEQEIRGGHATDAYIWNARARLP